MAEPFEVSVYFVGGDVVHVEFPNAKDMRQVYSVFDQAKDGYVMANRGDGSPVLISTKNIRYVAPTYWDEDED
ncbi:MAG: hypothetical protein EP340_00070 [Alphaproteobacteria bacterium]|nr:MAG: hypothetical protein EP340_00070 [Alphaproteobacteria bacterium]